MRHERLPYIGVTGVTTPDEARAVTERLRVPAGYRPMIGVLASRKTLDGIAVTNRRYPGADEIGAILDAMPEGVFRTIHFNTRSDRPLDDQLHELVERCGMPDGIQLNIRRPDVKSLVRFWTDVPTDIILQVNGSSLGGDRSPEAVAAYVEQYQHCCDHVLLDLSGGTGREIDVEWATDCVIILSERAPGLSVGVAGGLGPECAGVLRAINAALGGRAVSLDAEGRLRRPAANPIAGEPFQDDLDLDAVEAYAASCREVLAA